MTTEERITKLTGEGFDIVIGRHTAFRGYHVGVYKEDKEHSCTGMFFVKCGYDYRFILWSFSGHGYTIEEALINGELIARGEKPVKEYKPEDFEDNGH